MREAPPPAFEGNAEPCADDARRAASCEESLNPVAAARAADLILMRSRVGGLRGHDDSILAWLADSLDEERCAHRVRASGKGRDRQSSRIAHRISNLE